MPRRKPGEVRDAIVRTLDGSATPMSVAEITRSVQESIGAAVAPSSVRSYLNLNRGTDKPFERVSRGVYKLRP